MTTASVDLSAKALLAGLVPASGSLLVPLSSATASLVTPLRGKLVSLLVAEFLLPTALPLAYPELPCLACPWRYPSGLSLFTPFLLV